MILDRAPTPEPSSDKSHQNETVKFGNAVKELSIRPAVPVVKLIPDPGFVQNPKRELPEVELFLIRILLDTFGNSKNCVVPSAKDAIDFSQGLPDT